MDAWWVGAKKKGGSKKKVGGCHGEGMEGQLSEMLRWEERWVACGRVCRCRSCWSNGGRVWARVGACVDTTAVVSREERYGDKCVRACEHISLKVCMVVWKDAKTKCRRLGMQVWLLLDAFVLAITIYY